MTEIQPEELAIIGTIVVLGTLIVAAVITEILN